MLYPENQETRSSKNRLGILALGSVLLGGCASVDESYLSSDSQANSYAENKRDKEEDLNFQKFELMRGGPRDLSGLHVSIERQELNPKTYTVQTSDGEGLEISITPAQYAYFQSQRVYRTFCFISLEDIHSTEDQLRQFVTPDIPVIRDLALAITRDLVASEEKAQSLLNWVCENIRYDQVESDSHKNYFRFPIETLMEGAGDCEDTSILYASLCKAIGINIVLLRQIGHICAAVEGNFTGLSLRHDGKSYFLAETTTDKAAPIGADLGIELRGIIIDL